MAEEINYDANSVLEALNNKADRDLKNITDGTYDFLTTKQVTNCITKIPQDIKLELESDTSLTLKAGSKVYIPNGIGIFEEKIIQNDINYGGGTNRTSLICVKPDGTAMQRLGKTYCYSGDTPPTGYTTFAFWYDTANNLIKFTNNNGDSWEEGYSLPICEAVETPTGWTSINQIFNGFGYIGNTIFTLPNVEGLIPNGRNTDGSLNNVKFKTTEVFTKTILAGNIVSGALLNSDEITIYDSFTKYYENENIIKYLNNKLNFTIIESLNVDSTGRIISFNPKNTFKALDRNDSEIIINWGMPDYDLGVEKSTSGFTADKDGLILAECWASATYIEAKIDGVVVALWKTSSVDVADRGTKSFSISKGEKLTFYNKGSGIIQKVTFFPFKGVN